LSTGTHGTGKLFSATARTSKTPFHLLVLTVSAPYESPTLNPWQPDFVPDRVGQPLSVPGFSSGSRPSDARLRRLPCSRFLLHLVRFKAHFASSGASIRSSLDRGQSLRRSDRRFSFLRQVLFPCIQTTIAVESSNGFTSQGRQAAVGSVVAVRYAPQWLSVIGITSDCELSHRTSLRAG
jgi:hypothetical protein